jgi:hypothetical protein
MRQIIIRSVAITGVVVGVLFTGVGVAAAQPELPAPPEVVLPAAPEVVLPEVVLPAGVEADLGGVKISS